MLGYRAISISLASSKGNSLSDSRLRGGFRRKLRERDRSVGRGVVPFVYVAAFTTEKSPNPRGERGERGNQVTGANPRSSWGRRLLKRQPVS